MPVFAFLTYLLARGGGEGLLFHLEDGGPQGHLQSISFGLLLFMPLTSLALLGSSLESM